MSERLFDDKKSLTPISSLNGSIPSTTAQDGIGISEIILDLTLETQQESAPTVGHVSLSIFITMSPLHPHLIIEQASCICFLLYCVGFWSDCGLEVALSTLLFYRNQNKSLC
jgi:hypothetical protein